MEPELSPEHTENPPEAAASPQPPKRPGASHPRSARKRPSRLRPVLVVFLLIGGIGSAFWVARAYVLQDARFRLETVHLQGARYVAPSEVQEKFLGDQGRSILEIPLEERRREVEQIAWVRSATITRAFPNQLWVSVQERVPVAFVWTSSGIGLVDQDGVLLDYPPESSFTFPVVRGISERDSAERRRSKMQLFMAMTRELPLEDFGREEEISEVDLSDLQDLRVVLAGPAGAVRLHLGNENFGGRFGTYLRNIGQWKQKFPNIESIDLRYEGQAVINAGLPAPTAAKERPPQRVSAPQPPIAPAPQASQPSEADNPLAPAPSSP